MMSPYRSLSDRMKAEHERLERILEAVDRMVDDDELERAEIHFTDFRAWLEEHLHQEEATIFPRFDEHFRLPGPTQGMREEHGRILAAVAAMADALARQRRAGYREERARLEEVLPAHHRKEERILYGALEKVSARTACGIDARSRNDCGPEEALGADPGGTPLALAPGQEEPHAEPYRR